MASLHMSLANCPEVSRRRRQLGDIFRIPPRNSKRKSGTQVADFCAVVGGLNRFAIVNGRRRCEDDYGDDNDGERLSRPQKGRPRFVLF